MKRKNIINFLLFVSLIFLVWGCGDFLEDDKSNNENKIVSCNVTYNGPVQWDRIEGNWKVIQNNYLAPSWTTVIITNDMRIQVVDTAGRTYCGTYSINSSRITYSWNTVCYGGYCEITSAAYPSLAVVLYSNNTMIWTSSSGLTIIFSRV